jgi:tetratricopeptide (TPR) repeat protein
MSISFYPYFIGCCIATTMATGADPNAVLEQSRLLRRQFQADTFSAVAEKTPEEKEATLAELIEQVLSLHVPHSQDPNQPASSAKGKTTVGKTGPVPKADSPATPAQQTAQASPRQSEDSVAMTQANVIEILKRTEQPETFPFPIELADALYRAGHLEAAGHFYEIALSKTPEQDAATHTWLLFQSGNCWRHTEPDKARSDYEELIRLYPNSVWSAAAQGRLKMISRLSANQPQIQQHTTTGSENE